MQAIRYNLHPAQYAKKMVAIQCPSDDMFKSLAARILESVAPQSIRWSNRERAYIVSQRTADKFEAIVRAGYEAWAEQRLKDLEVAA